jgi:glucokinase
MNNLLAIEIGGTKLQAVVGDANGAILTKRRGAVEGGSASGILRWFEREIPLLLEWARAQGHPIERLGIGFGGPVDSSAGAVIKSHHVKGWDGYPLRDWAREQFGLRAVVANDTNAGGWAEYRLGAGRGTRNFFYMNIGSGIGGALIIDGKLYDGQGRGAAEIGHMRVPDWTNPQPRKPVILEEMASGWNIERRLRAGAPPAPGCPLARLCGDEPTRLTCAMLGQAAVEGDAFARGELDRVGESLGIAIANMITLFHPERIALGGGVSLIGEPLLEPIRRWAHRYVIEVFNEGYDIVPCALGEDVVLAGALLLAGQ